MNKYLKNVTATAFLVAASMQCAVAESSDIQLGLSLTGGYQFEGTPIKGYDRYQLASKQGNFIFGVRPSVGVALTDNLSLSLGLILDYSTYEQKRISSAAKASSNAQASGSKSVNNVDGLSQNELLQMFIKKPSGMKIEDFKKELSDNAEGFISAIKGSKSSSSDIKVGDKSYSISSSALTHGELMGLRKKGLRFKNKDIADIVDEYDSALEAAISYKAAGANDFGNGTTFAAGYRTLFAAITGLNTTTAIAAGDPSVASLVSAIGGSMTAPDVVAYATGAAALPNPANEAVLKDYVKTFSKRDIRGAVSALFGAKINRDIIVTSKSSTFSLDNMLVLLEEDRPVSLTDDNMKELAEFIDNIEENEDKNTGSSNDNSSASSTSADVSLKVKDIRIGISPSIAYSLPVSEDTSLGFALGFNVCHHSVSFDEGDTNKNSKLKYFSFDPSLGVELKHKIGDLASIGVGIGVESNNFAKSCGDNAKMEGSIGSSSAGKDGIKHTSIQFGEASVILNAKASLYFAL